ncbi:ATP-binding cassette domain-containing protein [Candidatus Pelagibacter sp. HIMB1709]|uniref:ATP-binding cassette domain-containing protein n=1 Tax=Candidatus Pelagibacter sp. HIMB1709 TaxID=3413367 RepID=UPI003F835A1C
MLKFLKILNTNQKTKLLIFFILNLFSVGIEALGISLVLPLLHSLLSQNNFLLEIIQQYFPNLTNLESIKIILLLFFTIFFLKNLFIIFFGWWQASFVNSIHHYLQNSLLKRYLTDDLLSINRINAGVKIRNVKTETSRFAKYLTGWMLIIVESLMIIGLLVVMLINNYKLAGYSILIFFLFFSIYYFLTKILSYRWAQKRLEISKISSLFLNESLKFIKDISLFNKQDYFLNNFRKNEKKIFNLSTKYSAFNLTPKVMIEISIITILVSYLFYILNSNQDLNLVVANIGFYFVIALRFYPASTKIIQSLNQIRNASPSIDLLYDEIIPGYKNFEKIDNKDVNLKIKLMNKIECNNISYNHADSGIIFKDANLIINKSEKILLISPSGMGKSTFLDILAGLIKVDEGKIMYDDIDISRYPNKIKNMIGYLSQESFVLNESLLFNITFENDEKNINKELIESVANLTQLNKLFSDQVLNLNLQIKENGSNLSGGQRQRIALSRLLYKNSEILILDEPTNEIDISSEIEIIKNMIKTFTDKTMIVTSHNQSLSKYFDKCYEIKDNQFKLIS